MSEREMVKYKTFESVVQAINEEVLTMVDVETPEDFENLKLVVSKVVNEYIEHVEGEINTILTKGNNTDYSMGVLIDTIAMATVHTLFKLEARAEQYA